ncbi:hypothetical protein NDU88_005740 [Pleurodeles waltl]|uniref:F-box domain-containing protein n=1 Tax=Pleurodeles waltl TaxID=8319 RepID=A0AAV7NNN5_PLEWA|nr:hypothetical protein NDU88_005740 [Pleurodeles waltl]
MTSLLKEQLYEIQRQAQSPSKDLFHLIVTKTQVILRSWRISVRAEHRMTLPGEVRKSHSDFLLEDILHKQIQRVFGRSTLEYTLNLCRGQYDFLVRMPDHLTVHILSFLGTSDIKRLSETCKKFQKLCNSEDFWEKCQSELPHRLFHVLAWDEWVSCPLMATLCRVVRLLSSLFAILAARRGDSLLGFPSRLIGLLKQQRAHDLAMFS